MTRHGEVRRVTVELLVKADSPETAEGFVRERMNAWFTEGDLQPGTAGFPQGTLLYFDVTPAYGHRAVAV